MTRMEHHASSYNQMLCHSIPSHARWHTFRIASYPLSSLDQEARLQLRQLGFFVLSWRSNVNFLILHRLICTLLNKLSNQAPAITYFDTDTFPSIFFLRLMLPSHSYILVNYGQHMPSYVRRILFKRSMSIVNPEVTQSKASQMSTSVLSLSRRS